MISPRLKQTLGAVAAVAAVAAMYGYAATNRVARRAAGGSLQSIQLFPGKAWYVHPSGVSTGDGSREHPLNLAAALSAQGPVQPGDTVWLMGGTYIGPFVSELTGTKEAPILVRQLPGERATIDSAPSAKTALYVQGAWTTYWGFELTNSSAHRPYGYEGFDTLTRGIGVEVRAPYTKLVNLVVHDLAGGFGIWSDAENAEAYGNIIYYNGFSAPDRGHGHGIYVQNKSGQRLLSDNVIFNQFDHGIHAYGSSAASLDHITLEGNAVFNNGIVERRYSGNILLGGGRLARDPVVRQNYTYFSAGVREGGDNNFGYNAGCSNLVASDNYFVGTPALVLAGGCGGTLAGNVFYGPVSAAIRSSYPRNTYVAERPTGTKIFVRPNRFEPGRANIVVYNWDRWRNLSVDLSAAHLALGAKIEIRDAQNFFGPPLVTETYDGQPVMLPMRGLTAAAPVVGMETPPHSAPEFGVFIVVPVAP